MVIKMGTKYIHYGSSSYDPALFEEPVNQPHFNKPDGGLWASPVDAEYGWKQWTEDNHFVTGPMDQYFVFELKPEAKVYKIRSVADVERMPQKMKYLTIREIDFEEMILDGWDAIDFKCTGDLYFVLYGWDCDSLLVLNREVIVVE